MPLRAASPDKFYRLILASFLIVAVFALQYFFRDIDDNRLTSWQWAFTGVDLKIIFLIFLPGLVAAYLLSGFSFPEHNPCFSLFFVSFAACMFFWKEPEVIVDASRYFTQAKHLGIFGVKYFLLEWGRGINAWTDLPLVPFLYGLIFKFFGESRIYIQIFTTFLFSITCVLTYLTGKSLWDEDTGFCAGMFLLGIPYLLIQVPLMLIDVPTMFFLMLAVYTFLKVLERGGVYIFVSSAAIFCAVFSKYSAWLMLSVLPVIFLVYLKNPPATKRAVLRRSSALVCVAGVFVLALILFKLDVFSEQIKLLYDYQMPGLRRWGESFVSSFLFQMHPFITISALYSLIMAFKKRDSRYFIICWLVILIVLLQIRRSRYLMIMFPMFSLMASYGLQGIKAVKLKKFIVYSSVTSSFIIAVFVFLPFLQKNDMANLRDAGKYLNSMDASHIKVFTLPLAKQPVTTKNTVVNMAVSVPILDLFTDKDIYYDYIADISPPFDEIKKAPLRFTWEYKNPVYYNDDRKKSGRKVPVVIISNGPDEPSLERLEEVVAGYTKIEYFVNTSGIFHYSPVVRIYIKTEK